MKDKKRSTECHFNLYLYSLRPPKGINGVFSKKKSLYRSQQLLTYAKFNDFESNFAVVTRWHYCITQSIYLRRNLPRKF